VNEHTLGAEYSFALQPAAKPRYRVVAYDCGVKNSILDNLCRCGCAVTVVPWDTPAEDVLAMEPNGVFLSNGPGDPDNVEATYKQVEKLLGKVPIFGICLGHQMICKASGATIEKLKFGHHGGNQPVKNMLNGRVEVTVQNHGFSVVFDTIGPLSEDLPQGHFAQNCEVRTNSHYGRVALTHVNLNDNTPEGIAFLDIPAFSVQYHPEASPGPTDSHYLFTAFTRLMDGREDYLDIDIAEDRLHEWKFANEEAQHA
jgi:carbamoyl-phosphate synthase small subunit